MSLIKARRFSDLFVWVLLLAALGGASNRVLAAQEPILSIPTVTTAGGKTVTTSVQYSALAATVAALQFDLRYDRNALTITATLGSASSDAGKTLATATLPNGDTRFIIFGLNQTVIGDGSVVDLTITVNVSAAPGPYDLTLLNALGATPSAEGVSIRVISGQVVNTGPPTQ